MSVFRAIRLEVKLSPAEAKKLDALVSLRRKTLESEQLPGESSRSAVVRELILAANRASVPAGSYRP